MIVNAAGEDVSHRYAGPFIAAAVCIVAGAAALAFGLDWNSDENRLDRAGWTSARIASVRADPQLRREIGEAARLCVMNGYGRQTKLCDLTVTIDRRIVEADRADLYAGVAERTNGR